MSTAETSKPKRRTSRREPIGMRYVRRGERVGLVPASKSDLERFEKARMNDHDLVFVDMRKPRNPEFHRLAHRIGMFVVANIEGFEHLDAHQALKRLQMESGVACEPLSVRVGTIGQPMIEWLEESLGKGGGNVMRLFLADAGNQMVTINVPISFSYASMDQTEFKDAVAGICKYISMKYLPSCDPEQVRDLVNAMVDE